MAKKRVLVAMSGGVDSSVAALLVQQQGHEVVGVTLNLWSYENRLEPYNECCSLEVRTVAEQLGIEHHFLDAGEAFKAAVVEPFVADYLAGLTPSPCGHCNRLVRFPVLLDALEAYGCDWLATGHHARVQAVKGGYRLLRGADPFKDQSYFLYGLQPAQLARLSFPVGGMRKSEVWALAAERGLVSARKPESQDLCFLPGGDYRAFLRQNSPGQLRPGPIVDLEGNVLGQHEGLPFYTVGQRRGLEVSLGRRAYVVGADPERNALIVGPEAALYLDELVVGPLNWLVPEPDTPLPVKVKVRYRGPLLPATWHRTDVGGRVRFEAPQRAVAPGQLVALYRGETLLGGGLIRGTLRWPDPAAERRAVA